MGWDVTSKKPRALTATSSLIHVLHRANQRADDLFTRAAGDLPITARQFVVMSIVDDNAEPSQSLICERSGIDRSTLADIVARLVDRGLLSRKRTKLDGRKYAIRLTDEGKRCLDEAMRAAQHVENVVESALTTEQRQQLDASIERFLAATGRPSDEMDAD